MDLGKGMFFRLEMICRLALRPWRQTQAMSEIMVTGGSDLSTVSFQVLVEKQLLLQERNLHLCLPHSPPPPQCLAQWAEGEVLVP